MITVFAGYGIIIFVFMFLAYKILSRDKKRLNVIFAAFFFTVSTGLVFNLIYYPLKEEAIVTVLNTLTNSLVMFGLIFLVVFELILLKSEKVITSSKQILILLIYGALLSVLFIFILAIPGWGVTINAITEWRPVWSLPYFLYAIVVTSIVVVFSLYLSSTISKQFEDPQLKKKWKFFQLGLIFLFSFTYGIFISNFLDIKAIRDLMAVLGLLFAILGGYLVYFGVGRQIEK
jgi:hypothetical protein